jgi:hypothetical protein
MRYTGGHENTSLYSEDNNKPWASLSLGRRNHSCCAYAAWSTLTFTHVLHLIVAFLGSLLGLILASRLAPRFKVLIVPVDAAALGLFSVSGATRALNAGLTSLPGEASSSG